MLFYAFSYGSALNITKFSNKSNRGLCSFAPDDPLDIIGVADDDP